MLGGHDGKLIGTLDASSSVSWDKFIVASIGIHNVHGLHSVTLVGREISAIMDLHWFKLEHIALGFLRRNEPFK